MCKRIDICGYKLDRDPSFLNECLRLTQGVLAGFPGRLRFAVELILTKRSNRWRSGNLAKGRITRVNIPITSKVSKPINVHTTVIEDIPSEEVSPVIEPEEELVESEEDVSKTEGQIQNNIENTLLEFWNNHDLEDTILCFSEMGDVLTNDHQAFLIEKLVGHVIDSSKKELVGMSIGIIKELYCTGILKSENVELGMCRHLEFIDDIAIDVPAVYKIVAEYFNTMPKDIISITFVLDMISGIGVKLAAEIV